MFRIAICDDERQFRKRIHDILIEYMNENDILYEIDEFESGKDFISLGINLAKYDIVFLDVNMDELDGMETAQKIRKVSNDVFIVFVTAFITCAPQGYSVGAIRYILKNNVNFPELIFECMDAISMNMNYVAQKKKFNFNEGAKVVALERLSNKVSSAMHTRILKGENISGQLRYGYVKDPNDKHKIIVDPEAAEVVKLIFELTAQGKSKTEVANYLNAQGIDTPSAYKKRKGSRNFFHAVEVKSLWSTSSIRDILNDEVYLGKLIWNKTKKRIGSNNTSSYVPKDEWMVIENCHEPIITQELFDMAHANSKKCVRLKRGKRNYNPFYYCGVCGRALAPSKRVKGDILLCYSSRIEENSPCKNNRVEIAKVEDAIMKIVNMYATAYLDEKGIKKAGKSKEVSPEEKIATLEKKVKSLSSKKMMLYSDYKDDKLTREEYVKRSKAMVEQIDELHQEIEQLKTEIPPEDNSSNKFETQLESIINMESFDREKIQKVIKKVIINGEDNIEIVWNTDDPFFK